MSMPKYKLTTTTGTVRNKKTLKELLVYQIQALVDIPKIGISKGDFGGFVEKESNLSQEGNAWIGVGSVVFQESVVKDDAFVYGSSEVFGESTISGTAHVKNAKVFHSIISKDCHLEDVEMTECTLHQKVNVRNSKLNNVVASGTIFLDATVNSKFSPIEFKEMKMPHISQIISSKLSYSGKHQAIIRVQFLMIDSKLSNVKSLSLKSAIQLKNVKNLGTFHLFTLTGSNPHYLNTISGIESLGFLKKSRIKICQSDIRLNGTMFGSLLFENCQFDTYGKLTYFHTKEQFRFTNVNLKDFSTLEIQSGHVFEVKNIQLEDDTHYKV